MLLNSQMAKVLAGAVTLLLGAGGVHRLAHVSRAQMASTFRPLAMPLSELPLQLGSYVFRREVPLDADVVRVAQVDSFVNREYVDAISGHPIQVYVGYCGQRNAGIGHGPEVCFPSLGWKAEGEAAQRVVRFRGPSEVKEDIAIALHHFVRTRPERVDRIAVGFTAVFGGRFRVSSRDVFMHLPPRPDTGFLANIEVVTPLPYSGSEAADARIATFMELLLPHVSTCLFGIPETVDAKEVATVAGGNR